MKLSYKPRVKEPFVLDLSTEELGLIRFHLCQEIDTMTTRVTFYKGYAKDDPKTKPVLKDALRTLKRLKKFSDHLEAAVQSLKY